MKRKVAIYARVSTEHEAQVSALENQIQYYDEYMERNPGWELYDRYIDEGLSATSYKKRPEFMRMLEDAEQGRFDLIVTREVSRFARNILDAIEQTRQLKEWGVEVIFTEDGISTMNDDDGELRLSIMSILAQNESKKISSRVKAGQMISFHNGVPYGNGNILGYDRNGREMVINKAQAETVRRIFDLALQGNGIRRIHYILEQEGRRTATGLTRWQESVILKVLRNPFYCGRIEYRKQYVPDYLKQKKVNNHGEVERVIVRGSHEPIVTEEEFDKVQNLINSRSMEVNGKKQGKPPAQNIWVKKLRCSCGSSMNRRVNYTSKTGEKSYMFQCHRQLRTGTVGTRLNKGLSIEGICENKAFAEWKVQVQADFIFRKLLANKQEIYDAAVMMLDDIVTEDISSETSRQALEGNLAKIDVLNGKLEVYADMCAEGDISRELFKKRKEETEEKIRFLKEDNEALKTKIASLADAGSKAKRLALLTDFIQMRAFHEDAGIPEIMIDEFVNEIVVDGDVFTWRLSPGVSTPEVVPISIEGIKKKGLKTAYHADRSTGCDQRSTWRRVKIGTFYIPKDYIREARKYYCGGIRQRIPDVMTVKVELV